MSFTEIKLQNYLKMSTKEKKVREGQFKSVPSINNEIIVYNDDVIL
jgi:hypothetical protein